MGKEKKSFLLRLDPELHRAIEQWSADEFRSVNGQIEFVLRDALRKSGRLKSSPGQQLKPPQNEE